MTVEDAKQIVLSSYPHAKPCSYLNNKCIIDIDGYRYLCAAGAETSDDAWLMAAKEIMDVMLHKFEHNW